MAETPFNPPVPMGYPPPPNRIIREGEQPPRRTGYLKDSTKADPIDPRASTTFDMWMSLPPDDRRTLEEFAANPYLNTIHIDIRG